MSCNKLGGYVIVDCYEDSASTRFSIFSIDCVVGWKYFAVRDFVMKPSFRDADYIVRFAIY